MNETTHQFIHHALKTWTGKPYHITHAVADAKLAYNLSFQARLGSSPFFALVVQRRKPFPRLLSPLSLIAIDWLSGRGQPTFPSDTV